MSDLVEPLYELMCDRVRRSDVIHTDNTGIKMLDIGQCRHCRFWTCIGHETNPYTVHEYSLRREGKEPRRFLEGFSDYLQADAFSGYDRVYSGGRIQGSH